MESDAGIIRCISKPIHQVRLNRCTSKRCSQRVQLLVFKYRSIPRLAVHSFDEYQPIWNLKGKRNGHELAIFSRVDWRGGSESEHQASKYGWLYRWGIGI